MPFPAVQDIVQTDLFTSEDELREKYPTTSVERLLRIRAMYNWFISNPDSKDKEFVDESIYRYGVSKTLAYDDLRVIKSVLPHITQASRDYHRWKYNEMILETYQMAKKRKDTKTMERAATSYAKFNNVNVEDEQSVPYDLIVVQPFTATQDPTVLGIKPIPNIDKKITELIAKYRAESIDIDDIEFEEPDIMDWADYEEIKETDNDQKSHHNMTTILKNINWDATSFFETLASKNKLAKAENFTFCRVSGLEGFEEVLHHLQTTANFIAVSDIAQGYTELNTTPHTRRVKTVFFAMRHALDDMQARQECMDIMRELFRQFMSVLIQEKTRVEEEHIYLDPRISFQEIDKYFLSGCACAFFQIATDVYTDLRYNQEEWE